MVDHAIYGVFFYCLSTAYRLVTQPMRSDNCHIWKFVAHVELQIRDRPEEKINMVQVCNINRREKRDR